MPSISIQAGSIAITAASNKGVLTVGAPTTLIFPGAWGWLAKNDGSSQVRIKVIQLLSTTTFLVRVFPNDADEYGNGQSKTQPFYTFTDVSTYNTSSSFWWSTQSVPIDPSYSTRNEA
jgi:hypothetical protein